MRVLFVQSSAFHSTRTGPQCVILDWSLLHGSVTGPSQPRWWNSPWGRTPAWDHVSLTELWSSTPQHLFVKLCAISHAIIFCSYGIFNQYLSKYKCIIFYIDLVNRRTYCCHEYTLSVLFIDPVKYCKFDSIHILSIFIFILLRSIFMLLCKIYILFSFLIFSFYSLFAVFLFLQFWCFVNIVALTGVEQWQ